MQVDIASLGDAPRRYAGTMAVTPETHHKHELARNSPIAFAATVELDGEAVIVTGWIQSTVHVACSRCLEVTPVTVDRELQLVFHSADKAPGPGVTELDAQRLDIDYYAGGTLDLRPVLTEQVLLDLPMKPLCSTDCRGLCPQCGSNCSEQPCDCQPAVAPQLSELAAFRDAP